MDVELEQRDFFMCGFEIIEEDFWSSECKIIE